MDSAISELIGSIYENPWNGGSWQPVIQQMGELTGSAVVLLSAFDLANRRLIHDHWHGPDSSRFLDAVRDYGSDMHKLDPMMIYASKRLQGGAVTSTAAAKYGRPNRIAVPKLTTIGGSPALRNAFKLGGNSCDSP